MSAARLGGLGAEGGMGALRGGGAFVEHGLVDAGGVGFSVKAWWAEFQKIYTGENWAQNWRETEKTFYHSIERRAQEHAREFGDMQEFYRTVCRANLYFFAKEVLGYRDMSFRLHFPLCALVSEKKVLHKLALFPRKHFKTTVCTIAGAIQTVLRDPEVAILMATGTAKLVREVTAEVKQHFQLNARFRQLFPEFVPVAKEWGTLDQFTVPGRKRVRKEPTWQAASTGTALTGNSYDEFLADDLIDYDDVNTKELIENTRQWVSSVKFLLKYQDSTPQTWSGTRYHFGDVYADKLADSVEKDGKFVVWVRQAIEDGQSIFPERKGCTLTDYNRILTHGSPKDKAVFQAQMMQNPTPETSSVPREKIKYHADTEADIGAQNLYLCLDAAASGSEKADFCAFVVWGATEGKELHCHEAFELHCGPFEFVAEVFRLFEKYAGLGSALQAVTLQKEVIEKVFRSIFEKEMDARGVRLPLAGVSVHKADKRKRINRIVPWFEDGKAKLRRGQVDFENQLIFGDKVAHDDIADCASDIVEVMVFPVAKAAEMVKREFRGYSGPIEAWRALHKQMDEAEIEAEGRALRDEGEEEFADAETLTV